MYADDTTLYCNIGSDVDETVINNELSDIGIGDFYQILLKSKCIVFHTVNKYLIPI